LRLRRFNPATIEPLASGLPEAEVLRAAREMDTSTIFDVQGMTCGNCVKRVTEAVTLYLNARIRLHKFQWLSRAFNLITCI
jgi:hypothetical protein